MTITKQKRISAVKRVLKRAAQGKRPLFTKILFKDERFYITDGYILAVINNDDVIKKHIYNECQWVSPDDNKDLNEVMTSLENRVLRNIRTVDIYTVLNGTNIDFNYDYISSMLAKNEYNQAIKKHYNGRCFYFQDNNDIWHGFDAEKVMNLMNLVGGDAKRFRIEFVLSMQGRVDYFSALKITGEHGEGVVCAMRADHKVVSNFQEFVKNI